MLYRRIIGPVLIFATCRVWKPANKRVDQPASLHHVPAVALGGSSGFLSGLADGGGGIFLSPVLILQGLADAKRASSVAAAFIMVNSVSRLFALGSKFHGFSTSLAYRAITSVAGGLPGSWLGSQKFSTPGLKIMPAVLLFVSPPKLLFS